MTMVAWVSIASFSSTAFACAPPPTLSERVVAWDESLDLIVFVTYRSHFECNQGNAEGFRVGKLSTLKHQGTVRATCGWEQPTISAHYPDGEQAPEDLPVSRLEWSDVAPKTRWAAGPLPREHTPDTTGRVSLVAPTGKAAYLAVRNGSSVERLLWLPSPRRFGTPARPWSVKVWQAETGAVVVIVETAWSMGPRRPVHLEEWAYYFTDDDLLHPRSATLQARYLQMAEEIRENDGLYRSAVEIGSLPQDNLPGAICSAAHAFRDAEGLRWMREGLKAMDPSGRERLLDSLKKNCPPAFLHRAKLGPKVKESAAVQPRKIAVTKRSGGPCGG